MNILLIPGVAAAALPLELPAERTADLALMIAANLVLFATVFLGRRHVLGRGEGGVLLGCYLGHVALTFAGAR